MHLRNHGTHSPCEVVNPNARGRDGFQMERGALTALHVHRVRRGSKSLPVPSARGTLADDPQVAQCRAHRPAVSRDPESGRTDGQAGLRSGPGLVGALGTFQELSSAQCDADGMSDQRTSRLLCSRKTPRKPIAMRASWAPHVLSNMPRYACRSD